MISTGSPFRGYELERLKQFLVKMELDYDAGIQHSICILDDEMEIIATASLEENVLKCIAISTEHQGEGLAATVISHLTEYACGRGMTHLMLYTKPKNKILFEGLNFHVIIETDTVLLMENSRGRFEDYLITLIEQTPCDALRPSRHIGAIVMNCNPFTFGHRYLIEQALSACDFLHIFILADHRTVIPAKDRFSMVEHGVADLDRIILHDTSDYIISAATFPTYFIKDKAKAAEVNMTLDLELFATLIAPALNISARFVGTEPNCPVTNAYNIAMRNSLPTHHIKVYTIGRKDYDGVPISASIVRKLWQAGEYDKLSVLVPQSTLFCLRQISEN